MSQRTEPTATTLRRCCSSPDSHAQAAYHLHIYMPCYQPRGHLESDCSSGLQVCMLTNWHSKKMLPRTPAGRMGRAAMHHPSLKYSSVNWGKERRVEQ